MCGKTIKPFNLKAIKLIWAAKTRRVGERENERERERGYRNYFCPSECCEVSDFADLISLLTSIFEIEDPLCLNLSECTSNDFSFPLLSTE